MMDFDMLHKTAIKEDGIDMPFMDFSFFPVAVDASVLAEADQEFENFENVFEEKEVEVLQTKSFHCEQSELADTSSSSEYSDDLFSNPSDNFDPEIDWCSAPLGDESESSTSSSFDEFLSSISVPKEEIRFKPIHEEKWNLRFNEFLQFVKKTGHGAVPHNYPTNPQLARWVKRQRRQYKLMQDKQPSTMTIDRAELLSTVGFIWDTHEVNWTVKVHALEQFFRQHGHSNVPTKFKESNLGIWVKCQRRQYKLYREGKTSAMTSERIAQLEKFNFKWEVHGASSPKNLKSLKTPPHKVYQTSLVGETNLADRSL